MNGNVLFTQDYGTLWLSEICKQKQTKSQVRWERTEEEYSRKKKKDCESMNLFPPV